MKALVKYEMKPHALEIRDIPIPEPGPGQIRVKVEYAGICGSDLHIYHNSIAITTRPPVVVGHEFSGFVDKVGSGVQGWKEGDRIVAEAVYHRCGVCKYCRTGKYNLCLDKLSFGYVYNGCFERYTIVEDYNAHHLPDDIDMISGAMIEPMACVARGIYDQCHLEAGFTVLVSGPGPIGLMAAQIAKAEGCEVIVTGTGVDEERLAIAKQLGIDHAVNIEKENLKELVDSLTDGYGVDAVLECSGSQAGINSGLSLVRKCGWFVMIALAGRPITFDIEAMNYKELHFSGSIASTYSNWEKCLWLLHHRKVQLAPLATGIYRLDDWKQAFEDMENKKGLKLLFKPEDD